jgi:hypothetical protein
VIFHNRHSGARSELGTTILQIKGMISMKTYFTGLAVAALLVIGPTFPGYAEDTAAPAAQAAPAATPTEAPASVPRPSIAPKTAEPASPPAADELAPRHRRYARHHRRYGIYRTAYWEPFPIYWPHLYHSRIHWNRISWFSF